jgi:hypothetical protein
VEFGKAKEAARIETPVDGEFDERQIRRGKPVSIIGGSKDGDRHLRNLILR